MTYDQDNQVSLQLISIGVLMVTIGAVSTQAPAWVRYGLFISGALTIAFNGFFIYNEL